MNQLKTRFLLNFTFSQTCLTIIAFIYSSESRHLLNRNEIIYQKQL